MKQVDPKDIGGDLLNSMRMMNLTEKPMRKINGVSCGSEIPADVNSVLGMKMKKR